MGIVSFPIKPSPLEEMVQRLMEYNPSSCCVIIMDDDRGISFIAPPDTNLSEINWALDIVKSTLIEQAFED